MNIEKKEIIISEIHHWKSSKLLPETYCNFLLALYTEGEYEHIQEKAPVKNIKMLAIQSILYGLLILMLASILLVIYFTELPFILQMTIVGICFGISIIVTAFLIRKKIPSQLPIGLSLIDLLVASNYLFEHRFGGGHILSGFVLSTNCMIWITIGLKYKLSYLFFCGIIGLIIIIATIIVY